MRASREQTGGADTDGQGEIPPSRRVKPAQRPGRILWSHATSAEEDLRTQRRRGGRTEIQFTDRPSAIGGSRLATGTHPLEVRLDIGLNGKKSEIAPQVQKTAALEFIDSYPAEYVRCYIDGSATEGTSDGGYGVYIEWKSQETTRTSGPVGRRTCSYECEKAALHACIRILKERHDRADQLPGVVILCDCRSLVMSGSSASGFHFT